MHPQYLAQKAKNDDERACAWLHDVLEDTNITSDDLIECGIPENIVNAVIAITHKKGEDRQVYLDRVKKNAIARNVKLYDLEHNSQLSRIKNPTQKDYDRIVRYQKEIEYLKK